MPPPEVTSGLLPLLRNRTFLLLESRGTAAGVGYTVYLATVLWLSYRLTGGIFLAGILLGVETAVYTLTFLAGPLIDRVNDKRWVYVACYPIQALAAFALGITYVLGSLSIPLLIAIVVLLAALWDLTWAADSAATRLLFDKDRLFAVSGLGAAIGGAVNIVLYLTAGLTIALFGAAGGSYLYAGLLVVGAALAFLLPIPTPGAKKHAYLAGFREGWTLFRGKSGKALRHLAIFQSALGFFIPAPLLLLTLYVGRFFAGSQGTFAGLYVAYLVGGILIGVVLGRLNPRAFIGSVALVALLLTGAILVTAYLVVGYLPLSVTAWFLLGVAATARTTALWNYMQGGFAPEVLARVNSNSYLFTGISSTAGALVVGALSVTWSPAALTVLTALGFAGSAALGFLLSGTRTLTF
ncbi:MAG: MFS transporter [Thermoplasmata archaeon]|jgi:hypothetical protein